MKIISINIDNTIEEINIKNNNIKNQLNNLTNTQGSNDIELLYNWNYNNILIKCYGWIDGDESLINKHQLCKSGISDITDCVSENIKLYGNIYILAYNNNNKLIDFDISEYGEFYFLINDVENQDDSDSESVNSDDIINKENIINNDDDDDDEKIKDNFDFGDIEFDYKENIKVNKNKIKQINNITKFKKKENISINELNYDTNDYE